MSVAASVITLTQFVQLRSAELGNRLNLLSVVFIKDLFSWLVLGGKCHVGLEELNEMKNEVYNC